MKARNLLNKGLMLLDRGEPLRGMEALREALTAAEAEKDEITLATSLCSLGELLMTRGELTEAQSLLRRVVLISRQDDVLGYEQARARELLGLSKS